MCPPVPPPAKKKDVLLTETSLSVKSIVGGVHCRSTGVILPPGTEHLHILLWPASSVALGDKRVALPIVVRQGLVAGFVRDRHDEVILGLRRTSHAIQCCAARSTPDLSGSRDRVHPGLGRTGLPRGSARSCGTRRSSFLPATRSPDSQRRAAGSRRPHWRPATGPRGRRRRRHPDTGPGCPRHRAPGGCRRRDSRGRSRWRCVPRKTPGDTSVSRSVTVSWSPPAVSTSTVQWPAPFRCQSAISRLMSAPWGSTPGPCGSSPRAE